MATEIADWRPTDFDLAGRAREGDHSAFHELVDRHAGFLFAVAVSMSGNAADAEDLVQETFAGAFRGLAAFEGRASVKTWLTRILVRQAAGRRRSEGRRRAALARLEAASQADLGQESSDRATDARVDVADAMRSLSPEHREVIALRELQGLSYDEIAEVLGVPRGTVESRLFRARRRMQELLKEYFR
ncbi:MAG: sigma-70 family RNA polymerase sigma factor [Planctomycetes bacterium]|nr:sigma-70 family RNA polymerase sigma factor [Planctomycetota bacterium]